MVKYTLIGCGRIAKNHIGAAVSQPGLQITALCDLQMQNALALQKRFNLHKTKLYSDYRQMLEEEKPNLVAIATDSGSHAAIALDALAAGCHVLIEKPVALSLADADALILAAKQANVRVAVCHQNRFNPAVIKLRKALDAGRLGRLLYGAATIRWNRGQEYYDHASWRGKYATDGGALMNQCIHDIDLLRWMLGQPVRVTGVTARQIHSIEAEDFGAAIVEFAGGAFGLIEGTTNIYPENLEETLCIFGTTGTVKLGGSSLNLLEEWRLADTLDDPVILKAVCNQRPPDIYGYGHIPLYSDMLTAIEEKRDPLITLTEGRAAMELVLAVYYAALRRQTVTLPLARGTTLDFPPLP